jgi:ribosomal protein S27AE
VKEIASERTGLPKLFFDPILSMVDRDLHKKIGHRFEEYKIKKYINQNDNTVGNDKKLCKEVIPSLFLASEMDKLVKCHHVEKLYSRYPGSPGVTKKLFYIKNQHHENRDPKVIEKCIAFINSIL